MLPAWALLAGGVGLLLLGLALGAAAGSRVWRGRRDKASEAELDRAWAEGRDWARAEAARQHDAAGPPGMPEPIPEPGSVVHERTGPPPVSPTGGLVAYPELAPDADAGGALDTGAFDALYRPPAPAAAPTFADVWGDDLPPHPAADHELGLAGRHRADPGPEPTWADLADLTAEMDAIGRQAAAAVGLTPAVAEVQPGARFIPSRPPAETRGELIRGAPGLAELAAELMSRPADLDLPAAEERTVVDGHEAWAANARDAGQAWLARTMAEHAPGQTAAMVATAAGEHPDEFAPPAVTLVKSVEAAPGAAVDGKVVRRRRRKAGNAG